MVCGLAYSEVGGSILYIEAREFNIDKGLKDRPGSGQVKVTGSLGGVMKESIMIAHTLAKNFLGKYFPDLPAVAYLDQHDLHVHVPEGATPKEGPSAGVALTTALLSVALGTPVLQDVAMTGEVTLTGRVLPIGGVKEKVLAAQREGIKRVILPKLNEKEFLKLPEFLRKDMQVFYAEDYRDVFQILFPRFKIALPNSDSKPNLEPKQQQAQPQKEKKPGQPHSNV